MLGLSLELPGHYDNVVLRLPYNRLTCIDTSWDYTAYVSFQIFPKMNPRWLFPHRHLSENQFHLFLVPVLPRLLWIMNILLLDPALESEFHHLYALTKLVQFQIIFTRKLYLKLSKCLILRPRALRVCLVDSYYRAELRTVHIHAGLQYF